ncbi:MAG: hypothetical protein RMJ30_04380 [Nitrososphaerota archaeon]|nr:hypothetical protein [Nitrososphaerota archaeon]
MLKTMFENMGARVSTLRVRIKNPVGKPPAEPDTIELPVEKYELIKLGLASLKIVKSSTPRVHHEGLAGLLGSERTVVLVDDYPAVQMLGYDGVDALLRENCYLIYVSHNFYDLPKKTASMEAYLMKNAFASISASERDRYFYLNKYGLSGDSVVVYPNIYPLHLPPNRQENANIGSEKHPKTTVVLNMGSKVSDTVCNSLIRTVHDATSAINDRDSFRLLVIGDNLVRYARGLNWRHEVEFQSHLPDRRLFLEKLSTAHIGINYAYKAVGSNIKKYDYALAGLAVLSNTYGCKGEILPREWVFYDEADLYVKLTNLLGEDLGSLGVENREHALARAQKHYEDLRQKLSSLL